MKPAAILDRLKDLGVTVMLDLDRGLIAGPAVQITTEVKSLVAGNRAAIIEVLTKKGEHGELGELVSETFRPETYVKRRRWTPGHPFTCKCGELTGWATDGAAACPLCAFDSPKLGSERDGPKIGPVKCEAGSLYDDSECEEEPVLKSPESRAFIKRENPGLSAEAKACFKVGYPWVRDHLDTLLAAGWTRRELFGRGRHKWPYGDWGAAWLSSWGEGIKVSRVSIGQQGEILIDGFSSWPVSRLALKDYTINKEQVTPGIIPNHLFRQE